MQCLLESFRGAALAANRHSANTLFNYLLPVLSNCVPLVNVYQNCPEVVVLVFELFVDVVDSQIAYIEEVCWFSYVSLLISKSSRNLCRLKSFSREPGKLA